MISSSLFQALEKAVSQYKADREAVANKLFRDYDLGLVATVAAKICRERMEPKAAANEALKLLDACQDALSARRQKFGAMVNAKVPVEALNLSFNDGICAITNQHKRLSRAEEYFRKFLVSELGSEAAADELKRLRRDGFTIDEVRDYEVRYAKFRPPRKQKS
jgi:hypothetical protein